MAGIITDLIQNFDMEKAKQMWQSFYDGYAKVTGAYIYPNGMLGNIPIFIKSHSFSSSNSVTSHKTFEGVEVADNVSVEPYTINIKIIAFGDFYIDVLEMHEKAARESNGQKGITTLYFEKFWRLFGPLVITKFLYSHEAKDTFLQEIDIDLKYVEVRKFVKNDDGVITTETLGADNFFQNQEILAEGMPRNWFDELSRTEKYREVEDAITNSIKLF